MRKTETPGSDRRRGTSWPPPCSPVHPGTRHITCSGESASEGLSPPTSVTREAILSVTDTQIRATSASLVEPARSRHGFKHKVGVATRYLPLCFEMLQTAMEGHGSR